MNAMMDKVFSTEYKEDYCRCKGGNLSTRI